MSDQYAQEDRILSKLEEIQTSQSAMAVAIAEIKGDNKVQNQVMVFHVDQLKEFKGNTDKRLDDVERRVHILEKWQARLAGIAAVVAVALSFVIDNIREALFGK